MLASLGKEGDYKRYGHWLNGYTAIKHSKCLKYKK
jgi:hypothetical protein